MSDFLSDLKDRIEELVGNFVNESETNEVNSFYAIKPECQDEVPKIRFRPRAGKTLGAKRWDAVFSQDGHLDMEKVLRRIQRGGIHPSIKGSVWEFLLGCFDPCSTFNERNQLRQQRRKQYEIWKDECRRMAPFIGSGRIVTVPISTEDGQPIDDTLTNSNLQPEHGTASTSDSGSSSDLGKQIDAASDRKVVQWKLILHQIGLDVVRTDRTLVFYDSEFNQAKLWNILSVYAWVDSDIGYCQGMNDICSPMVVLLENEADAFWCFEHAMRRLRENFRCSSVHVGVQSQLVTLSNIIKSIDPKLHQHFEEIDGGDYFFAFRMLMVLFRREFSFVDALYLWELMWAMEYNPALFSRYEKASTGVDDRRVAPSLNRKQLKQYGKFEKRNLKAGCVDQQNVLAVFLVANVLETKNKRLIREAKGLDDVVKILGDITQKLDAKQACKGALRIQTKYLKGNRA